MIVHIIMIKLKEDQKNEAETIRTRLLALPPQIDVIKHYDVGLNIVASSRNYDVVVYSKFTSLDTMAVYIQHPKHQEVAAYIGGVADKIAVVDYEE